MLLDLNLPCCLVPMFIDITLKVEASWIPLLEFPTKAFDRFNNLENNETCSIYCKRS